MQYKRRAPVLVLMLLIGLTGCLEGQMSVDAPEGSFDPGGVDPTSPPTSTVPPEALVEGEIDVARVTMRRMNRAEMNNTLRDLLGDTTAAALDLPDDDFGYGFNNIGDVLSTSPLHVELLQSIFERVVDNSLSIAGTETTRQYRAEDMTASTGGRANDGFWNIWSNGDVSQSVAFESAGSYVFRIRAYQHQGGPDPAGMNLNLNGATVQQFQVPNTTPEIFEATLDVTAGTHIIAVEFTNDYYNPDDGEDRNLLVEWVEVAGPVGASGQAEGNASRFITCDLAEASCAGEVIANFGLEAWRRPMTQEEIDRVLPFVELAVDEGESLDVGIRLAMRAILSSPNFYYRVEIDPEPENPVPRELTDWEMASRLSYFIWSSMPDRELFDLAAAGQLQDDEVIRQQVRRMVADPRAEELINNFATQWLYIDAIDETYPDTELFPDFDEELRAAMREETRRFVEVLIAENLSIDALLTADFTFINDRLALHYELPSVDGWQRITLDGEARRGILGHGGLLTSLSFPTRTSAVKRGAWVLGHLLCDEPPAPPPEVENLQVDDSGALSVREQLAQHSQDRRCVGCHSVMDPIGLGMENFDAIGAWRDEEFGRPIDSSGELPGEIMFNGAYELAGILAEDSRYTLCVVEKTLSYAIGRGIHRWDRPQLVSIADNLAGRDGFVDLMEEVALSPAFRMRRGGELQETR